MLYTPMLPEAASGTLEPRHVVVPLRQMCPHAELAARPRDGDSTRSGGSPTSRRRRRASSSVEYEQLVVALGAVTRTLAGARPRRARARLQGPRRRDPPAQPRAARARGRRRGVDAARRRAHLSFVFVGAGYAGVEALAELSDLVHGRAPLLSAPARRAAALGARRRGAEDPARDPDAPRRLRGDGARRGAASRSTSRRRSSRSTATEAVLSNGERIPTRTLVWTAGVRANPLLGELGLPLDERGRVRVDALPPRRGPRARLWSLGDCAAVPNARDARHASTRRRASTRSARRGGSRRTCTGEPRAVRLPDARPGRDARPLQGDRRRDGPAPPRLPGLVRHAQLPPLQLPLLTRKLRVVTDWTTSLFFRRDIAELSLLTRPRRLGE